MKAKKEEKKTRERIINKTLDSLLKTNPINQLDIEFCMVTHGMENNIEDCGMYAMQLYEDRLPMSSLIDPEGE